MALAARIASRHPEVGLIERGRYHVVLLDEYQDTSHAQLVLLRALFSGGHPVTAVGDPCQSIYGWRGASAGNLRRFSQDFPVLPRPAAAGRGGLARTGEAAVDQLPQRRPGAGHRGGAAAAAAGRGPRRAPAEARAGPGGPRLGGLRAAGHRGGRGRVGGRRVKRLLMLPPGIAPDGQPWPDGSRGLVRPSDIAILCRKRSQFPALRRALEARDIPVEVVGLGGLLTVPEVQDVVATLRVLDDAAGSDSLVRLLTGPRWRIGPRDLVALGRRARALARADQAEAEARTGNTPPSSPSTPPARHRPPRPPHPACRPLTTGRAGRGADRPHHRRGQPGRGAGRPGRTGRVLLPGLARFRVLAGELRMLRGQLGRPLPDLIGEVERTLGLDIELASRPCGADRSRPGPTWTRSPTLRTRSPAHGRSRRWGRSWPT